MGKQLLNNLNQLLILSNQSTKILNYKYVLQMFTVFDSDGIIVFL